MTDRANEAVTKPETPFENFKPDTQGTEQRIDSTKLQVGNSDRGFNSPPKSAEDLAGQLNAVYNAPGGSERFDNINKDLAKSFKSAYEKTPGGEDAKTKAVKDLELKINDKTVDGKGILVQVKDGQLSLRHLEAAQTGELHPEFPGVHIKDIGNKLTADLRGEKNLEKLATPAGSADKADTKQFPSDVLFHKAMTSSPEWANAPWKGANESQQKLLDAIKDPKVAALAKSLPEGMLDAQAGSPKEVNDFLEKKGFGRLLQERPDEEAVAATMNIKKDWTADKSRLVSGDKEYSSVDKNGKVYNVDGKPVVELFKDPNDGITIYAIPNKPGVTGEQAMEQAKKLIPKADQSHLTDEGKIRAPMLDLSATEDLNWLKNMKGGDLTVTQAKMQTTLKMDENGFDAKQAIAMGASRGIKIPKPPVFQLDSEFTFVIAKDGQPVFAIPVEKNSWKDPKRN
jgi:hypothetical protein